MKMSRTQSPVERLSVHTASCPTDKVMVSPFLPCINVSEGRLFEKTSQTNRDIPRDVGKQRIHCKDAPPNFVFFHRSCGGPDTHCASNIYAFLFLPELLAGAAGQSLQPICDEALSSGVYTSKKLAICFLCIFAALAEVCIAVGRLYILYLKAWQNEVTYTECVNVFAHR